MIRGRRYFVRSPIFVHPVEATRAGEVLGEVPWFEEPETLPLGSFVSLVRTWCNVGGTFVLVESFDRYGFSSGHYIALEVNVFEAIGDM